MEIQEEPAIAAQKHLQTGTGRNAAVDDLTTAIMTGASPAEISRLEVSAGNPPPQYDDAGAGQENEQGYEQGDENAGAGRPAGDLPPGEPKNAERIRLTGLEERDKGLVNAANIIARTEKIPFDEAWRRVNGILPHGGDARAQAQAGQETQGRDEPQQDGRADDDARALATLRDHHLQMAGELYSDLKNEGSAHWREANRIATDPSHPDHDPEMLSKPHAPMIVAKLAAANLGLGGGAGAGDRGEVFQPASHVRPAAATKQSAPPLPGKSKSEIARESEQAALDAVEGRVSRPGERVQRGYLRL